MTTKLTGSKAKREEQRAEAMFNGMQFTQQMLHQADLRGISAADVCESIIGTLSARNPELAGKVLMAVDATIATFPIKKIIGAGTLKVEGIAEPTVDQLVAADRGLRR